MVVHRPELRTSLVRTGYNFGSAYARALELGGSSSGNLSTESHVMDVPVLRGSGSRARKMSF